MRIPPVPDMTGAHNLVDLQADDRFDTGTHTGFPSQTQHFQFLRSRAHEKAECQPADSMTKHCSSRVSEGRCKESTLAWSFRS